MVEKLLFHLVDKTKFSKIPLALLVVFLFLFNKGTEKGPHHITEPMQFPQLETSLDRLQLKDSRSLSNRFKVI